MTQTLRLLMTAREAANAMAISERTLWGLTKNGEIPCVRVGQSIRYDLLQLQVWIDSRSQLTASSTTTRCEKDSTTPVCAAASVRLDSQPAGFGRITPRSSRGYN
jgi:excisionase family DNA binding protein